MAPPPPFAPGGHWGDWAFRVGQASGSSLIFSEGGYQEARGGGGQQMYVEGPKELLDVVGEWHWDPAARVLTVAFNGTAHDGSETLVAAQLAELVRVTGSRAAPMTGVTLSGITFAHTSTDYFLPFTVPSGGDWSFHDGGMVRLAGTEGCSVLSCVFSAPGGTGLQISEHNRATVVRGNHFAWSGSSAITSAGLGGNTPTGGDDFPEGTLIEGNLMREIGVYVKQCGGLYQGVSANLTLRNNVMFNAARAAVSEFPLLLRARARLRALVRACARLCALARACARLRICTHLALAQARALCARSLVRYALTSSSVLALRAYRLERWLCWRTPADAEPAVQFR